MLVGLAIMVSPSFANADEGIKWTTRPRNSGKKDVPHDSLVEQETGFARIAEQNGRQTSAVPRGRMAFGQKCPMGRSKAPPPR